MVESAILQHMMQTIPNFETADIVFNEKSKKLIERFCKDNINWQITQEAARSTPEYHVKLTAKASDKLSVILHHHRGNTARGAVGGGVGGAATGVAGGAGIGTGVGAAIGTFGGPLGIAIGAGVGAGVGAVAGGVVVGTGGGVGGGVAGYKRKFEQHVTAGNIFAHLSTDGCKTTGNITEVTIVVRGNPRTS